MRLAEAVTERQLRNIGELYSTAFPVEEQKPFSLLLEIPTEQSDVFEFCKKGIYIYSALLYLDFYDESVCELVRSKETRRR